MGYLRHIKDLLLKYKFHYLGGIISLILVDCLQLSLPAILGIVTDVFKAGQLTTNNLMQYTLAIVFIALSMTVFRFFWRYFVFGTSKAMEKSIRDKFYFHLQRLSADYYNNHKTGDLMAHATNDIGNISTALGQGVTMAFDCILVPVVAIIMMLRTAGPGLTLASASPLLLLALLILFVSNPLQNRIEKMQESFSFLTEKVREHFSGIRVVKSFAQEPMELNNFHSVNSYNRKVNLKYTRIMSTLFPLVMAISSFSFVIAIGYGGNKVINAQMTLGGFVAFNSFLMMLIWPTATIGWTISIFQRGIVSLKRINAILEVEPEIVDKENLPSINRIEGDITLKNLTFTYPGTDKPVLKNINVHIEKGKTLAIVGRTGSGKSTLIHLLQRIYNVADGSIFIDRNDINNIPLSHLRDHIGCVPQDTFLFSTTIRENIDFFQGNDEQSIISASKIAKVYDNIMEFPLNFETIVGERGVNLSGGQKQRISIARAINRLPGILILDDCLSAVDTQTEEEILKGLKMVMKQRTSIIVSHRISTIKDADEIIVLENGEIAERGNHETLLDNKGLYYDLYRKQLLAEEIAEEGEE